MDMLADIEGQKQGFIDSEQELKDKEKELEQLEAKFMKEIDFTLKEARDQEAHWLKREADVARVSQAGQQTIDINIRDKEIVKFSKSKLMHFENSLLAHTFSGAHQVNRDENGKIFLDNNPEAFTLLLDFLNYEERNLEQKKLDEREKGLLETELDFWGIKKPIFLKKFGTQIEDIFSRDPKEDLPSLKDEVAQRWKALNPLTVETIDQKAEIDIYNQNPVQENEGTNDAGNKFVKSGQLDGQKKLDGLCRNVIEDEVQEGQFKGDQMHGFCRVIYSGEKDHYIGLFKNNQYHGNGKMVYKDERVEEGEWKAGKFVG